MEKESAWSFVSDDDVIEEVAVEDTSSMKDLDESLSDNLTQVGKPGYCSIKMVVVGGLRTRMILSG